MTERARVERHRHAALIALAVFFVAIVSREAFRHLPVQFATPAWKLFWVLLCFLGLLVAHRMGVRAAIAELGLGGSVLRGLGIALVASVPMLVALLFISRGKVQFAPGRMFSVVILAALTEEILFRGYLFRQLYRRGRWSFLSAVLITAALFGLAHITSVLGGGGLQLLGVTGITAVGGAFFAWLLVRWDDNLWVPIGVHLFMNVWWDLFAVAPNAIGNWGANIARALTIAAAVVITLRFTRKTTTGETLWSSART